jgi:ribosomal protein S18 acetylase RimI-like enzyme
VPAFARRVQEYLLHSARRGREVIEVPPFVVTIDPSTELRFLNYAIPHGPGDPAAAVDEMRAAMRSRGRLPRLEFVAEANEGLDAVLADAGFEEESRLALMTCMPSGLTAAPEVPGARIEVLGEDSPHVLLEGAAAAAGEAFGESGPVDVERRRGWLAGGGIGVAAVIDGRVVGGASATPVADGLTEVAGVGVLAAYRRRGLAAALTEAAARQAFAQGADLALLTPGHDDAQRIYARAGFTARLTMLTLSDPLS